jgi:hypothetical protein
MLKAITAFFCASAANAAGLRATTTACSTPAVGSNVTTQPCNTAGAANAWTYTSLNKPVPLGQISLQSAPSLCMTLGPVYPLSSVPLVVLGACNSSDPSQMWAVAPTGYIFNGNVGDVMEVYDNVMTPGAPIEVYNMNSGANQQWSYSAANGQLSTALNGMCASVC